MALHKQSPAPACQPGTGRIEIEAGCYVLNPFHSDFGTSEEAFTLAWLARHGVRPALATTVAALARIGGAT